MKKIIVLSFVMLMVLSTFGLAQGSVTEVINDMITQGDEVKIILSDNSNTQDTLTATDIGILLLGNGKVTSTKLVSEVELIDGPTILIGGPCVNRFTEEVMKDTCETWSYQPGEGIISYYNSNGNLVLVVAGTLAGDTRRMGNEFKNYQKSTKLGASLLALFGKPESQECGNNICETGETDQSCSKDCSTESSIQLTSTSTNKGNPRISGNNLVWVGSNGIMLYKGNTGEIKQIGGGSYADIDGDYVVSTKREVYQISTGRKKIIPSEYARGWPSIHNGKVVYFQPDEECPSQMCAVYLYDISTEDSRKLFVGKDPSGLGLSDEWVVYSDEPRGFEYPNPSAFPNIYAYNIISGENKVISSAEQTQYHAQISGDFVVWEDKRGGDRDIYMYDLSSDKEWGVTNALGDQIWPVVDGNIISWVDYRNGNEDIYYCDMAKNGQSGGCLEDDRKTRVTFNSVHQGTVDVSNNVLVWTQETSDFKQAEGAPAGFGSTDNEVFIFKIPEGGAPIGFNVQR